MQDYKCELIKKAMDISNNKIKLKQRLLQAKSCLETEFKNKFKYAKFDFTNKCLNGDDCKLQWLLQKDPNKPISYYNQQTSIGNVQLIEY